MTSEYDKGFTTLDGEYQIDALPVSGRLPGWLAGTLVRNGPGKFELPSRPYNHWFDGLAMLHRFTVADGAVSYANRYLHSQDYQASIESGGVSLRAFATDPCMSVFKRVMSIFDPQMTDNANINVVRWADRFIALTESPFAVEFDPITLETTAHHNFADHVLRRAATTAHPHTHPTTGRIYNFAVRFDVPRSAYRIYTYDPQSQQRDLVADIPVMRPAYIHSFGLTEHYAVIAAYPLTVNVVDLAFSGRAFIQNYAWAPQDPTRFYLVDLQRGQLAAQFDAEACFAFHHINAYEEDNRQVVVDLVAYPDTRAIDGLYLDRVRQGDPSVIPSGEPRRYRLDPATGTINQQPLSETLLELPRVNDAYVARPYQYAYGISSDPATHVGFPNQLAKINVETGESHIWREPGCYPGEPVFVAAPGASAEDDGVLLSVVLDTQTEQSFLLVLDAATMTECARATVPHHIPFGFHGQFYGGLGVSEA
jgi:beta,beta-carotene 9',10'-dioxygenase